MSEDRIISMLDEINRRLDRIEKILMGNGGHGILQEIAVNTSFRKNYQTTQRKLFAAIAGSAVAALGSLITALLSR